jgi:hypothetical protein
MSESLQNTLARLVKGVVVAGLVALTVAVFSPGFLVADDCESACLAHFKDCKKCDPPWEDYNGEFSHCEGTSCYYVCGSLCEIEPH